MIATTIMHHPERFLAYVNSEGATPVGGEHMARRWLQYAKRIRAGGAA